MRSTVTDEISECLYEDPDAPHPISDGGQSDAEVKPKPFPRIKSQLIPTVYNNVNTSNVSDSSKKKANTMKEAVRCDQSFQSKEKSAYYMMSRPFRLPPLPPVAKNMSLATAGVQGESHNTRSINGSTAKLQTLSLEKKPPLPPPRRPDWPPTSPLYYDRPSNAMSFRSAASKCSSVSSSQLSLVSVELPEDGLIAPGAYEAPYDQRRSSSSSQRRSPSLYRPSSMVNASNFQIRPSPPSFRPPPPPSSHAGSHYYNDREYVPVIPDEPGDISFNVLDFPLEPHYQYGGDSIYQLTTEDIPELLRWLKRVSRDPDVMSPSLYGLGVEEEISSFTQRAMNVRKARRLYNLLMMKHQESLQKGIQGFQSICDKLDKVKKKDRTMGIAGGTTGAVGGVAAVAGVALAPMTMGISLVATAVGAGMLATAGGLGVRGAKASKNAVDRTKVETMVNDYKSEVVDLEQCLAFILPVMNELRRYNITKLQTVGAHPEALRMAHLSHTVLSNNVNNSRGVSLTHPGGGTSTSLLKAFASEMDRYFTEDNRQKLKKSNKNKFSGVVTTLVRNLKEELDYVTKIWKLLN